MGRGDGSGRHPAQRLLSRQPLTRQPLCQMAQQQRPRFIGRQHIKELRHGKLEIMNYEL
jgi:hypothetical protein